MEDTVGRLVRTGWPWFVSAPRGVENSRLTMARARVNPITGPISKRSEGGDQEARGVLLTVSTAVYVVMRTGGLTSGVNVRVPGTALS